MASAAHHLLGYKVDLFATHLDKDIAGMHNYERRTIQLNCWHSRDALLSLLHEMGHAVDYLRRKREPVYRPLCSVRREYMAYCYGWALIRWFAIPVSKAEWRAAFKESIQYHIATGTD